MSKIAVFSGENRYQNIQSALDLIREEIAEKIKGKSKIVIKPNLCVLGNPLAVTSAEAIKALVDFLIKEFSIQELTIAEGAFDGQLELILDVYGYREVLKGYPVKYVDLNFDNYQLFEIHYLPGKSVKIKLAKTILDSDFIISLCPPKTHNAVIVTLSLKNLLVGSIVTGRFPVLGRYWRRHIHKSFKDLNLILFEITKIIKPQLAIIDGVTGMEGDGPDSRRAVQFNLAAAGLDAVAVDSLIAYLMGFNPQEIGYLYYAGQAGLGINEISQMEIIGVGEIANYQKRFKPHSTYQKQLQWR